MENTITKKVKQLSRTQQGVSLTQEDREILDVKEGSIVEVRKPHKEFIKEVAAKTKPLSVPEQTEECMKEGYEFEDGKLAPKTRPEYDKRKIDVNCEGGEKDEM